MKSATRVLAPLATSIALLLAPTHAAEISKANNTDDLNFGTSWNGGVVPGLNDVALLNSNLSISATLNIAMGGDHVWQGLRVTNIGGTRNQGRAVILTNAGSGNTLTLGSGGVDMGSALQAVGIQSRLTLSANQTWNVTNANDAVSPAGLNQSEDLAFLSTGANIPVNLGGFTVTKTGSGTVAFSSGYTISSGAFNVNAGVLHFQGGSSRVTTINNTVSFNVASGGTLRFAAQSGSGGITTQVNAPITINGGTLAVHLNQDNTVNLTGNITASGNHTWTVFGGAAGSQTTFSGNLIGSGNITYANTNTNANGLLRMSGDNSGYSGTFTVNGASGTRALRLTGANAGSANATWNIAADNALQVDGQSVQLGTLTGAGSITNSHASIAATLNVGAGLFSGAISNGAASMMALTKTGPGTLLLSGANTYTGPTLVNGGVLMTTAAQTGSTTVSVSDGATFGITHTPAGGTFATGTLTTGTTTGSTLRFDTGVIGNPTAPMVGTVDLVPLAPTQLQVLGTNLSAGTITLVDYSGGFGSGTFSNLSLTLPFRVSGLLVHNTANTSVDVNISGVDTPRWRGNINGNWDIDPDNTGTTGTANWLTSTSAVATRYVEGAVGVDSVIFDDSATGTRNINLTTVLSPLGTLVNNSAGDYTFAGPGKLSGGGTLTKEGTGTLTLANPVPYDFTGGTTISAGALQLGDGVTAGSGQISGPITNNATLVFEHADDQTVANKISGTGAVVKVGASTTTLTGELTYTGETIVFGGVLAHNTPTSLANPVTIQSGGTLRLDHAAGTVTAPITNDGTVHLNGAASMNAPISGIGGLLVNATGTKTLGGAAANTFTGVTIVNAGTLNLAKNNGGVGAVAISGDLIVNGGAVTVGALGDQFADSTDITVNTGTINTANRTDTVASVTIHSTAISTLSGLNITGPLTITAGAQHDVVNSGGTTTAEQVNLSNTNVRLGANSGPSTLNIGAGGLSLANANIVYGSAGAAAQTGTVVLAGNVTASGTSGFDVNTGNPRSFIDLGNATRGFNIVDGTTTVEASIISTAPGVGLHKAGPGTLILAAGTNGNGDSNYTGETLVSDGTLLVNGSLSGTSVIADGGTLGGNGVINPGAEWVVLEFTSKLSPGAAAGLSGTLTVNGNLDVFGSARHPGTAALQFDLDLPTASDRVLMNAGQLFIGDGQVEFDDFAFTTLAGFADQTTYTLFETNNPVLGFLGPNTTGTINGLAAEIQLSGDGTDLVLVVPEPGSAMLILGGIAMLGMRRSRQKTVPTRI